MAAELPALEHHVPGDEKSLVVVPLAAGEGAAKVYTFGACCVSYVYAGVEQLAARADTKWDGSKGLSAGIPHCFPQFGPPDGRTNWSGAQHGFGRSVTWRIIERTPSSVTMRLTLDEVGDMSEGWGFPFAVDHTVSLSADGSELSCATTVTNTGVEAFSFTAALHSYLACSDCDAVAVHGNFKGATYIDKVDEMKEKVEDREVITLEGQFYDRMYRGVTGVLKLTDTSPEKPDLELRHSIGWQDTVVSSPFPRYGRVSTPAAARSTACCRRPSGHCTLSTRVCDNPPSFGVRCNSLTCLSSCDLFVRPGLICRCGIRTGTMRWDTDHSSVWRR
jgi:glucose-6-phosphate 1-epimerase